MISSGTGGRLPLFTRHNTPRPLAAVSNEMGELSGWGSEDKQNTAPLKKPYYDTNTAYFPSCTLSRYMFAISLWLSHS